MPPFLLALTLSPSSNMATAELFNREVRANKSPRNAFSMSYGSLFTSPCGQLLPTYVQEVKKGDKLKLGVSSLTRTSPVVTPAFMSFDEKTDFWFVPYRLIWSDYDAWRLGQTYRHKTTDLAGVGAQNYLPYTNFSSIGDYFESFRKSRTSPFSDGPETALRYLDLLMYSVPDLVDISYIGFDSVYVPNSGGSEVLLNISHYYSRMSEFAPCNYFRLAAFQCIYMHCYRNDEYEVMDPSYYNCDNLFANLVGSNSTEFSGNNLSDNVHLVLISPLDSQQKIPGGINDRITLSKLFTPRFKNWRKDIFTSAKPDSGFNVQTGSQIGTNLLSGSSSTYGTGFYWPTSDPDRRFPLDGTQTDMISSLYPRNPLNIRSSEAGYDADRIDWTYQTDGSNPANVVSRLYVQAADSSKGTVSMAFLYPQNIRNLMAQDKFSRAALYAKKDISAQFKALFGENYTDPNDPIYLGSYSASVQIDDVTAQSAGTAESGPNSSTSILGELAGKVKQGGDDGNVFERSFDSDGIVIGVHYVMPRNNYDSYRLSRWNTKISRFDYFYPQFDGLGLQPILTHERYIGSRTGATWASSLFGFAPRYHEYKQRVNEVHSTFQSGQPDFSWTLVNNGYYRSAITAASPYVYKIIPTITDSIFATAYDGSMATDPFQHYYYYNATLVSDMEVYGTPSL